MVSISRPCGVVVSAQWSCDDLNAALLCATSCSTLSRSRVERATAKAFGLDVPPSLLKRRKLGPPTSTVDSQKMAVSIPLLGFPAVNRTSECSGASMAADIFAKLGDIKGESVDSKHKDEIEVLSYLLGCHTGWEYWNRRWRGRRHGDLPGSCHRSQNRQGVSQAAAGVRDG